MENATRFGLPRALLFLAAAACFAQLIYVPWHGPLTNVFEPPGMDPDPLTVAIWGLLLVRRALAAKDPPLPVVISGCFAAGVFIIESHKLLKLNDLIFIPLFLAAAACFLFWEPIQKRWTPKAK
jgi:hypothetical protein